MPKIFSYLDLCRKSLLTAVQVAHRDTTPPISQMGKLRPRETKGCAQGHTETGVLIQLDKCVLHCCSGPGWLSETQKSMKSTCAPKELTA